VSSLGTAAVTAPDEAVGRRREFELAVRLEGTRLLGLAYSILRDAGDAEDAVQETMVRAWRAWETLEDADRPGAWLTRICINHCLRRRRQLSRWFASTEHATAAQAAVVDEDDLAVDDACRRLTLRQRTVITLHYRYGYPLDDCATLMGCRPGTVRSHLARALATLRREMSDE